jgi:hypothetical protein
MECMEMREEKSANYHHFPLIIPISIISILVAITFTYKIKWLLAIGNLWSVARTAGHNEEFTRIMDNLKKKIWKIGGEVIYLFR